jgi:aspartate/methionine/tyrosine aminotransferase
VESLGAYFAYVRHPLSAGAASAAGRLASNVGVLTLPGPYFGLGQERHLRFAFANVAADALAALPARLAALAVPAH